MRVGEHKRKGELDYYSRWNRLSYADGGRLGIGNHQHAARVIFWRQQLYQRETGGNIMNKTRQVFAYAPHIGPSDGSDCRAVRGPDDNPLWRPRPRR